MTGYPVTRGQLKGPVDSQDDCGRRQHRELRASRPAEVRPAVVREMPLNCGIAVDQTAYDEADLAEAKEGKRARKSVPRTECRGGDQHESDDSEDRSIERYECHGAHVVLEPATDERGSSAMPAEVITHASAPRSA